MIELPDEQQQQLSDPELLGMDEYDPDEGTALINEVMAEDDAADQLLERYQHYEKPR